MRRLAFRLQNTLAAMRSVPSAVLRRRRQGPTRPSWTWSEELFVAAFRAVLTSSARNLDLMASGPHRLRPPLDRKSRKGLDVSMVDLDGVTAERYRPKRTPSGTMLRFHGGGFVSGSFATERRPAAQLALATNCDMYAISYRLAPAHPYPAALEDAMTAYRTLLDRGTDPAGTIFFGASSGAGLALATLLKARDLGLPMPAGAVLLWPYADFTFSGETIGTNAEVDTLPLRDLAHIWGPAYVGDADPANPLVSPALAELDGLPPLLILAGGAESLLSCAERIAASGRRAGVETTLSVYPDKVHGWMILPHLPATAEAVKEIVRWVTGTLRSPSSAAAVQ